MRRTPAIPRYLALFLIFVFFATALVNIDHATPVHDDEPWILSPGYTLLTEGHFGSGLMAGYAHMEQHYLQFLPLFPLAQGLMAYATGLGVFQLRFLPVCLGMLSLALAFAVARTMHNAWAGVLAVTLLLFWQWMPNTANIMLRTGIPLFDMSRIARYDIAVAPTALAALWAFMRPTRRKHLDVVAGLCLGLAGLTQAYGLFWLAACVIALALTGQHGERHAAWRRVVLISMVAGLVVLPWVLVLVAHLRDVVGQARIDDARFDVLNPAFYLSNLLRERQRYLLGALSRGGVWLPGFWVLVLGVPLVWVISLITALRRRQIALVQLCIIIAVVVLLFAVLIQPKTQYYLPSIAPLLAVLMSIALARLMRHPSQWLRLAAAAMLGAVCASGGSSLIHMQQIATRTESAQDINTELRALIPAKQCVLGPAAFWLGLTQNCYRTFGLAFVLHLPGFTDQPMPFDRVMEQLAPSVVILDESSQGALRGHPAAEAAFQEYLHRHQAQLIATLHDNIGRLVLVYRLRQP